MSALPNYSTVTNHGVVTHVIVPIEEFERLAGRPPLVSGPTDAEIDAAIAAYNDPATEWTDGEDVFRSIVRHGVEQARKTIGLTQAQLGAAAGLTQSQISRLESAPDRATLGVLRRIAQAMAARTSEK